MAASRLSVLVFLLPALLYAVGLSDPIHYRCTVWNAVSEESGEIRIGPPCTKSQRGSRPVEGLSTSLYTVFPIIIIIIIIAIICVKVQKARCRNPEERTLPDQSFQQVPTIPNNYVSNDLVVFNPAAHAKARQDPRLHLPLGRRMVIPSVEEMISVCPESGLFKCWVFFW
ncbi:hypothetical protein chiPu_0021540 [Chiloscyllium punctatum]|uniref:Uncharacterized protein n=1 Tax=Chiloscyllium punctatum TaxID=137246 RepID=A0A401RH75_CHIPU|nr:hypothetical protein [Chiloscyllium punctatum]